MTETMRDVLAEPVEIRGGFPMEPRDGRVYISAPLRENLGGYCVGMVETGSGVVRVQLRENGVDTPLRQSDFAYADEGLAEFDRLVGQLRAREMAGFMVDLIERGDVLPAEFAAAARSGDPSVLLIAADYQDDRGEGDKALLLRAAYYRASGAGCVEVKAGKKVTVVYNAGPSLTAAVVTAGESIRTVGIKTTYTGRVVLAKEYAVGDMAEYGSYNLTYYGPIKSITAKTVTVSERYGNPRTKRLKVADFVQRNYDFDLAAAQERNANFMD